MRVNYILTLKDAGQFNHAVFKAAKAIEMARQTKQDSEVSALEERLAFYRQHKSCQEQND